MVMGLASTASATGGSIGTLVWSDVNNNGLRDAGELDGILRFMGMR